MIATGRVLSLLVEFVRAMVVVGLVFLLILTGIFLKVTNREITIYVCFISFHNSVDDETTRAAAN